jgi:asparagine synthase (glutamine-hydrolysing)
MCGITGFLERPGHPEANMLARVAAMAEAIANRGPDSRGHWIDADAGIAFGHLRLAIVDLTETGAQPMGSHSGRYKLVYNGEIYNHTDLRAELEAAGKAPRWRGHSDTETLLAGFDTWGLDATLDRAVGMFAIALWDRKDRRLSLARDRMGEKPLYYGWQGEGPDRAFLFGSELKALARHPSFEGRIDRNMLPELLRHGHIGENRAIYCGLSKIRPGEIVEISQEAPDPVVRQFWSGAKITAERQIRSFAEPAEAVDALEARLLEAVERQMMSDVPLGAFLSGGIDSSTVVALMQRLSGKPVHTFSIGFHEERYNEAEHARAVAAHLGTRHTDLYIDESTLLSVVPKLSIMYDEPHADSSQIPTYLVAKLAREHVTVALSGDGGDELFAGYDRYAQGTALMQGLGRLPLSLRRLIAGTVRGVPRGLIDAFIEPMRPTPQGKENNGQRIHRLADYLRSRDLDELHRKLVSRWRFPEAAVPGAVSPATALDALAPSRGTLSDIERMMQLDMLTYMPDDILAKVDRATMAVSLESRAPLLDHKVVEFAWSLSPDLKHRNGISKWLLRQVLYRYVPRTLIDRPKMGFEVPIGLWLRGPLKDWAAALLDRDRLIQEGWFDTQVITRHWEEHLSGQANWGMQLWNVLMFQAWLDQRHEVTSSLR